MVKAEELKSLERAMVENFRESHKRMGEMYLKMEEMNTKMDMLKQQLREEVHDMEKKLLIEMDERHNTKDRIIISGVNEMKGALETTKEIMEYLDIDASEIIYARRMGKEQRKPRKILVKLGSEDLKNKVLRKKGNLKNSANWNKIYMDEDLSTGQREKLRRTYEDVKAKNEEEKEDLNKEGKVWIVAGRRSNPFPKKVNKRE